MQKTTESKNIVTSMRLPQPTRTQIDALAARWNVSIANVLMIAIDRMYQQEIRTMTTYTVTYTVTNERYSNEPVTVTLAELEQLVRENEWDATLTETYRNGKQVIVDQRGEIVAEAE